jgi:uncharacterized protein (DUF2062 family)
MKNANLPGGEDHLAIRPIPVTIPRSVCYTVRRTPPLTAANPIRWDASPDAHAAAPAPLVQILRPVVIAATHNNAATLPDILNRLGRLSLPIIVVNDGSTDTTAQLLQHWIDESAGRFALDHPSHLGKSAALRNGFHKALELDFTHAVTIDTDGRLFPEDIPKLLEAASEHPCAFILGARDIASPDYPKLSRIGQWISNLLLAFQTRRTLTDSPCSLRVYPLQLTCKLPCRSGHFGFETEVLARALWAHAPIIETPVRCQHLAAAHHTGDPWLDSLRLSRLHLKLILIALNPIHRKHAPPGSAPRHSLIWQFLHWLNPLTAWRQVRQCEAARTRFAAGCAAGVFIANLPIYGGQTILALYTARRFRLHPASTMAGVHVSTPPLGPLLIALGIAVGHWILHGSWPSLHSYHMANGQWKTTLFPMLCEWVIGSTVLGLVMGTITFFAMDLVLRLVPDSPDPEL